MQHLVFSGAAELIFDGSWTILHSHQQCVWVPISPHPHQHLLLSVFMIIVIPVHVRQFPVVDLISLMTNDIEHLSCAYWPFVYLLWRNVCLGPFLTGLFVFLLLRCRSSLHVLDINPLSDIQFADIFFLSWFVFSLVVVSFLFSLEHYHFTTLCQFLLYRKVNQSFLNIYPLLFGFPSHLGHHRAPSRIACACAILYSLYEVK